MSSEMVERVAKAMWESECPNNPWDTALDEDYYDGPGRTTVRSMARAAIEAMREPTKEMKRAAFEDALVPAGDFVPGWQAAIDAALTLEGTEP